MLDEIPTPSEETMYFYKKESMWFDRIFLIIMAILMFTAGSIGYSLYQDSASYIHYRVSQVSGVSLSYKDCANLSLEPTASCLRDYVRGFYNYTIRTDVPRTITDIKANGGDCYDYAHLYDEMAKALNFSTEVVNIYTNTRGHAFAVIADDTGYCKIDQLNIDCFLFGELPNTNTTTIIKNGSVQRR